MVYLKLTCSQYMWLVCSCVAIQRSAETSALRYFASMSASQNASLDVAFCHRFNDGALAQLGLRGLGADPRGLNSGGALQSVLMR